MKFDKFDRANTKALQVEMEALLAKYGVSANLDFKIVKMGFSDNEVEIKLTAKVKGAKSFDQLVLESRAAALGIKLVNKDGDALVAFEPRKAKPYIFTKKSGGTFCTTEEAIKVKFAA